ncbi:TetR/AcrR family transcriptional regulator [uncultured Tateyamaria sp.]|uniref:TetR/AcrR family transcriptional regulator n=1 Tax=uncultured Tateyamaria sp. TaxID=455651 RepID=UPI002612E17E|nr:TetR/AcrR family transcriptional regulator [uncultured Tateyamaria sp.]
MRGKTVSSKSTILEAGFDLLSRNPGASLAEIAAHAGVGRATLHRHFTGRADLVAEMALVASSELNTAVDAAVQDAPTYAEGLRVAFRAMLPLAQRYMFLGTEPVEQDPRVAATYAAETAELYSDIDAAKAEGAFDTDVPTAWIAQAYENLLYASWAMVAAEEATPNQAADLAWRTLTTGLKPTEKHHDT